MNLPNKITTFRMILVIFISTFLLLPSDWFILIPGINVSLNWTYFICDCFFIRHD